MDSLRRLPMCPDCSQRRGRHMVSIPRTCPPVTLVFTFFVCDPCFMRRLRDLPELQVPGARAK
jgi:hypothetical protein